MIRPLAHLVALVMGAGAHVGDAIPRVELPNVRKGRGYAGPGVPTGKGKSQAAPFGPKYRAHRRARVRMQKESRRRNRGGAT